jgi:hypothetical protein
MNMLRFRSGWFAPLLLALALLGCKKKEEKGLEATAPLALPSGEGVPEEVVGYFLMGNPSEMISQMEKLGSKVGPVPPGAMHAMIIQSLLQLGLKDTSVIDLKGPAGVMVLNPKTYPVPVVAAYSTAGRDKVIEALEPVWKKKGETDGVLEMVREETDTYEVFEGGAQAKPKATLSMFLKFEGQILYAAKDAGALKAGMPHLKKAMQSQAPKQGALGMLMLNHLRTAYQMELAVIPETIKQQLALEPSFARAGDPEMMKWLVGWMIDKLIAFVNQTREVAFTANVAEDGAVFQVGLVAEKGSFFQKLLAAQQHTGKPLKLLSALPEGHFFALGINVQWQEYKEDLLAFTTEIMKVLMGTEPSKEYIDAMLQMWEVMGDEVAISEDISSQGIGVVELIEVKDESKAREVFTKVMKLTADLFAKNEKGVMGMKFGFEGPKALGDYQGVKLEAIDMTWDFASMPPAQAKMLEALYGDKLRMVMALSGGNLALTMGKQAEEDMQALIDRMKGNGKGLGDSETFKNAAGGLDKGAGGVMYMSIARLIAASAESTYAAMGKQAPAIRLPSPSSGLFLGFSSTPQRLTTTLRLPAQHLAELGAAIKAMMQPSMDRH